MSFVRPRELASFDSQHVSLFPPIGKRISAGRYRYNNIFCVLFVYNHKRAFFN